MLLRPVEVVEAATVGPVHFIAIGGSGMNGVARLYAELGLEVSGSDQNDSLYLKKLSKIGVKTYVGHNANQLGNAQTVVISSAVRETNPELVEAKKRGLRIWHRSAALAALMMNHVGIAISGTHGKTTTTAMTATLGVKAGLEPSYVIGGSLVENGVSSHLGAGSTFIVEADESDGSFLQYPAEIAVVTSVDADHLVNWGTPEAYAEGFRNFTTQPNIKTVIINIDGQGSKELASYLTQYGKKVITYGESDEADIHFYGVETTALGIKATLVYGVETGVLDLQVPGVHNLVDACAAYAVGRVLGVEHITCLAGLNAFKGTLRRIQLITDSAGVRLYDDYAHHPTEVGVALDAARSLVEANNREKGLSGRLIACFQPHLYSRTQNFYEEFGEVLTKADIAVVNDVCGAREDPIPGITGELVVNAARNRGVNTIYVPKKWDLPDSLNEIAKSGDLVITLGCGDITDICPNFAKLLQEREQTEFH